MKVYSIEKEELYLNENQWKTLNHDIWDIVSSRKKVINTLYFLDVTNEKGKTIKNWEQKLFPFESYTREFTIDGYEYKDIVTIREWEMY